LDWVLTGMNEARITDVKASNDPQSIRTLLESRGFEAVVIDAMIAALPKSGQPTYTRANIPSPVRERAELQARQIALATFDSRVRISDLQTKAESIVLKSLMRVSIRLRCWQLDWIGLNLKLFLLSTKHARDSYNFLKLNRENHISCSARKSKLLKRNGERGRNRTFNLLIKSHFHRNTEIY